MNAQPGSWAFIAFACDCLGPPILEKAVDVGCESDSENEKAVQHVHPRSPAEDVGNRVIVEIDENADEDEPYRRPAHATFLRCLLCHIPSKQLISGNFPRGLYSITQKTKDPLGSFCFWVFLR